jgi:Asp-tRNA(Asn)/Glu-tRNA(Gln) amidotransferase A subunit family amidase
MKSHRDADRRAFFATCARIGVSSSLFAALVWQELEGQETRRVTLDMLRAAAVATAAPFGDAELTAMVTAANEHLARYETLRRVRLDNSVAPPLYFNPLLPGMPVDRAKREFRPAMSRAVAGPTNLEAIAFWPVTALAPLLRTRQITSAELTEMYLARLKRFNPTLRCAVTVTEDRAREQARTADREIAAGRYRGPLHGIPWGAKDIIAVKGYPTTWGAAPFKDRVLDEDATVVTRLDAAGAVLVAKLATGELARDDRWFGGQTMNPWDVTMGSQGSSAGPASATAAGLVGFSLGSETLGSIVEPAGICGVTGLRPTFGRVSRHGVMTISWSLDKVGPMCRSVEDCALVLRAIQGPDDHDMSLHDLPFNWNPSVIDIRKLRVGYLKAAFDDTRQSAQSNANDVAALGVLRSLGLSLVDVRLPEHSTLDPLTILYGEANAALDDPVRAQPQSLVRQDRVVTQNAMFFLPASAYLDANRVRMLLMQEMARVMTDVDVYVVPFDYSDYTPNPVATLNTNVTNLTGQPCVQVPHGFDEKGHPTALAFIGRVFGEVPMLALARAYQESTDWHRRHPTL